jgi:hypothetical protein
VTYIAAIVYLPRFIPSISPDPRRRRRYCFVMRLRHGDGTENVGRERKRISTRNKRAGCRLFPRVVCWAGRAIFSSGGRCSASQFLIPGTSWFSAKVKVTPRLMSFREKYHFRDCCCLQISGLLIMGITGSFFNDVAFLVLVFVMNFPPLNFSFYSPYSALFYWLFAIGKCLGLR